MFNLCVLQAFEKVMEDYGISATGHSARLGIKGKWSQAPTLYKVLLNTTIKPFSVLWAMTWAMTLEREIEDTEWGRTLTYMETVSRNNRFRLIQFNYQHQTYLALFRLQRVFGSGSSPCLSCHISEANFIYIISIGIDHPCVVIPQNFCLLDPHFCAQLV